MKANIFLMIIFVIFGVGLKKAFPESPMEFKLTGETSQLTPIPIDLIASADLNGNGIKEVLFTDFSYLSRVNQDTTPADYHFIVMEWDGKKMKKQWERKWPSPVSRKDKFFNLTKLVRQLNAWEVEGHKIVEAYPPYFKIQWENGSYQWNEQYDPADKGHFVGSWVFPFQSAACHAGSIFASAPVIPNECVLGVRDFGPNEGPRVVTRLADKEGKQLPARLRVRRFEKDFPIEWEGEIPVKFEYADVLDPSNIEGPKELMMNFGSVWLMSLKADSKQYELREIIGDGEVWGDAPFFEVKTGATQTKDLWEYWGYRWIKGQDGKPTSQFQKTFMNTDRSELLKKEIAFPAHERFIGIGSFALADMEGDGLDEVVFVEQTGKRSGDGEHGYRYSEVADYIRILKWTGKAYEIIWTSPPIKKRNSKVLVDDVMGKGKKQIVVGTGHGTIQIWEQK